MEFELDMYLLLSKFDMVVVYFVLLKWMLGVVLKFIVDMFICKQYNGDLLQDVVWIMLFEFEKGFWFIIYY